MKKWIWISIVVLIISLGITAKLYANTVKPLEEAEVKAKERALSETELSSVLDFSTYYGSKAYFVVKGKDDSGKTLIAWIPEEDEDIVVLEERDGISKEEAIQKLKMEKKPKEIIRTTLGMEDGIPVWELYYRSENGLINYYYIDFESGQMYKNIQNL